jgi:Spy/CpxP family protein refolding chaperone
MDTNRSSRKAILLVFTVFLLGIALGAIGVYGVTSRVQAARVQGPQRNALAGMIKELNLSPDQEKAIETILSDTQAGYAAIRKQADPQYEDVRQQGRQRIRQVLTPEQGPKFEDILRRMDEERRKRQADGH